VRAELCLESKPLHRLCRLLVYVVLTKPIVSRGIRTSKGRKTPLRLRFVVERGLDLLLADPLVLIGGVEAWLEEAHTGGSETGDGSLGKD
jgi:hypothetical protein